jgi:PTH2 family peptidyl-tRNA hydrolase
MAAILSVAKVDEYGDKLIINLYNQDLKTWLVTGRFKKVTVYVETEQELIDLYDTARKAGLPSAIIKDAGLTEFNGVPTITAVGIGPGSVEEIDAITGNLKLF